MTEDEPAGRGPEVPGEAVPEPEARPDLQASSAPPGNAVSSEPDTAAPQSGPPAQASPAPVPQYAPPAPFVQGPGFLPPQYPPPCAPPQYTPQYPPPYTPPYAPPQYTPQYAAPAPYGPAWGYGPVPGLPPAYWPAIPPAGPAPGLQWAGMAVRLGALLIDAVIVVGSEVAISFLLVGNASSGTGYTPQATAVSLGWWIFALAYHPACWYLFGATAGQRVLGMRVVRAYDGLRPGIGTVLVRYLIFFTVTIFFPIGIISGIVASADPRKQAWHDDVAGTVVVRRA